MRLKVDLTAKQLPVAYNTLFMSAIKEAIKASDPKYYEALYFYEGKSNKITKNLTFSVGISDYELKGEYFNVKGKISLIISTPDLELGLRIYNGMLKKRNFTYKTIEWTRLRVDLLKERQITTHEVLFKTLSPICIKNKQGKFIAPNDEEYGAELNYITNLMLENYRGTGLKEPLIFTNVNMKKVVVKETLREFKNKTGRDYLGVNAYRGSFILKGNVEDLQDIYTLGVGFKRSQGFGNIDVAGWR